MRRTIVVRTFLICLLAGVGLGFADAATAQTLIENSHEARFQLDLQVPEDALLAFIPDGWSLNVSTRGPATDANLRAVFIDRLTVNGPDGNPLGARGSNRLVYLITPVTNPAGENVQLVIGGLTEDAADVPGPFGVYRRATTHVMARTSTVDGDAGRVLDTQDWVFEAASGEHLEMHITFERGAGIRRDPREVKFYSAENPNFYQISREQQVLDILRNVTTTPPDRVTEFSFTASGGGFAQLFDGTERVLSWDNIVWLDRAVLVP